MIKLLESKIVTGTRIYGRYKQEYAIILTSGECSVYREGHKVQTMYAVVGIGFDPENGETMTSDKYKRVIKTLGSFQTAIDIS